MGKTYIIRVFDAGGRLVTSLGAGAGQTVQPGRLAVGPGYRLEIMERETGLAPKKLLVRRNGSNLELYLEDGPGRDANVENPDEAARNSGETQPDVVVQGFYGQAGEPACLEGPSEGGGTGGYPVPERDGSLNWTTLGAPTCGDDLTPGLFWLFLLAGAGTAGLIVAAASSGGSGGGGSGWQPEPEPEAPNQQVAITSIYDDQDPVIGIIADNELTNDSTPTLSGSISESLREGEYVAIFRDGVFAGRAELNRSDPLSWSFTDDLTVSPDGSYSYTAKVMDDSGRQGPESNNYSIVLKTEPPAGSVTITAYVDDVEPNVGEFGDSVPTNDTTPLLKGVVTGLEAGDRVLIYLGTAVLGEAVLDGAGGWTFQIGSETARAAGLSEGRHVLTAVIEDAAGNQGAVSEPFTLVVDLTAPTSGNSVIITAYTDSVPPETGDFGSGTSTDDSAPLLKGTVSGLAAGDTVLIFDGTVLLGAAEVSGNDWVFQMEGLSLGRHVFKAVIADAAGNRGTASSEFSLTVVESPPVYGNAVEITAYLDDQEPNVGEFSQDVPTNDRTPILKGTVSGLGPNDYILIYDGSTLLSGRAVLDGVGGWSYQLADPLSEGTHEFRAVIANDAGGEGTRSDEFALTVDLTPPTSENSVSIVSFTDDVEPVVGDFGSGAVTNDASPLLHGTVEGLVSGDLVLIFEGESLLGRADVSEDGTWSFQLSGLGEGGHSFTAVIADAAGNRGTASEDFNIIVDTTPPTSGNSVSITAYYDDVPPNVDFYPESVPTNDTSPMLTGTVSGLRAGDVILLFGGSSSSGTPLGQAILDGSGNWTFQLSDLAEGSHTFTAVIADAAGNRGTSSNSFTITVDLTPPISGNAVAITSYLDDQEPNVGEFGPDMPTNDASPVLVGTVSGLHAGDVILLFGGISSSGTPLGQAILDGSGNWTFQLSDLAEGSHTFTAVIADAAGNRGTSSNSFTITVDLTPPTSGNVVAITSYLDDQEPNVGEFGSGVPTNDASPVLIGTANGLGAGDVILLFSGSSVSGTPLGQAILDGSGNWTFQLSDLAEGSHTFTAVIADAAGNRGTSSNGFTITVDLTPPTSGNAVAITSYLDDQEPNVGEFGSGVPTNDSSPVLIGTVSGLQAGDRVLIYQEGILLGEAALDGAQGWSFALSALAPGVEYRFTAVIADAAGNQGTRSAEFLLIVDTSPPTEGNAIAVTGYYDDQAPNTGIFPVETPTNDASPLLRGTVSSLREGDVVLIFAGTGSSPGAVPLGRATVTGGQWTFQLSGLNEGDNQFTAVIADAAGNRGTSAGATIVLDTVPPTTGNSVAVTSYLDDVEPDTGEFGPGTSTDDRAPLLKGSVTGLEAGDQVLVFLDGVLLGSATINGNTWTFQVQGLELGWHSFTAVIADQAGNRGTGSGEFALTVVESPPVFNNSVEITSYVDDYEPQTGEFSQDVPTNDQMPLLKGVVSGLGPSDYILVYQGSTLLSGRAVLDGSGGWSYQITEALSEGTHTFTAVIANDGGGEGTRSQDFVLTVDLTPPGAGNSVAITSYTDDVEPNVGDFGAGTSTNDVAPLLNGTVSGLAAGDVVLIFEGSRLLGQAEVDGAGGWSFQLNDLAQGSHSFRAVIADAAGNRGTGSNQFTLIVDTEPPVSANSVSITSYLDDQAPNTGEYTESTPTNDTSPQLIGTVSGLQAGDVILVFSGGGAGGTLLGQAVANGSGGWTFQLSGLAQGSHSFTAVITDAAGNRGTASNSFTIVVDLTAPDTGNSVAITGYNDDQAPNVGEFPESTPTNDTSPQLIGTVSGLQAGDVILVFSGTGSGGTLLGQAVTDGSGGWTFQLSGLAQGSHSFTAVIADAAGNRGTASNSFTIVVDLTAPDTGNSVAITGYNDDQAPNVGEFPESTPTNDTSPQLIGTVSGLQAGDVILVFSGTGSGGTLLGQAVTDGSGGWTFQLSGLAQGSHSFTAVIADAAGNRGTASNTFIITVDLTAPTEGNAIGITGYYDDQPPNTGIFSPDVPTNDDTPLLGGTVAGLQPGDMVLIFRGSDTSPGINPLGQAVVVDGEWTFQLSGLSEGDNTFTAVIADASGNRGTSASAIIVLDTMPPTTGNSVAITSYLDDEEPGTGEFGPGTTTNDPTPLLKGTVSGLAAGDVVLVYEGATLLGQAEVSGTTWTFQVAGLDLGAHTFRAVITDSAGNRGTASADFTLTVVNPPPIVGNAVEITSYVDNVEPKVGEFTERVPTNDQTPLLNGVVTGLGALDYILIYQGSTLLSGRAVLDGSGGWSYQVTGPLAEGTYTFTAVIANDAGGEGTRSAGFEMTVDLTPPTTGNAIAITSYTDDVEPNVGIFGPGTSTNDVSPVLHGTASGLDVGDVVLLYEGSTFLGQTRVNRAGTWAFQLDGLSEGAHTFTAYIVDAAGNRGTASNNFSLMVDLTPPTTGNSISITGYYDDQPPNIDEYPESVPTNDTSPLLIGSVAGLEAGDVILVFGGSGTNGPLLGQAIQDGLGGWTFQLSGLTEGSHTFTAVIADAAGNRGTSSNSFTITVDLTPPTSGNSVEILSYLDNQEPNVGEFNSGVPTNDTSPVLAGTVSGLRTGDVVLIFQDGQLLGQAVMIDAVNWNYALTGLTPGMEYRYTAVIADAAGNRGTSSGQFLLIVDTTPPTTGNAINITGYYDDQAPNTGIFSPDVPTNDASPLLRGTVSGLQEGDVVLIFAGTNTSPGVNPVGQAVVSGGNWTFQLSGLSEGNNQFTAVIADAAGNRGTSAGVTLVLDTSPPLTGNSVTISSYIDDQPEQVGEFPESVPTNDTSPLIKGTYSGLNVADGEYILVYHGSVLVGRAVLFTDTGEWQIQASGLNEGTHVFTAVIVDAAGNEGTRSNNFVLVVDLTPPTSGNSVAITAYYDDEPLNTGDFLSGVPTNDQSPLLKGTVSGLQTGDIVLIYSGSTLAGQAVVDGLGGWTLQLNGLDQGTYQYQAVIADAAGNQGTRSNIFTLIVDTTPPASGTIAVTSYIDRQEPVTGEFDGSVPTDDTSPVLKGTVSGLESNGAVHVYQDGVYLGKAVLDGSGGWTYQLNGLSERSYTYQARIADAAGNEGPTSGNFILTVEFPPVTGSVAIVSYDDDVEPQTGNFGPDTSTNDTLPLLRGTVSGQDPGDTVRIYDGATLLGTAVLDGSGGWQFQVESALTEGDHFFTAVITASGGTEGTRSSYFKLTVDLTAPTTGNSVAITSYLDDVAPNEGEFTSGVPTNDTSPLLQGTVSGLQTGDRVLIFLDDVLRGSAVLDDTGGWSFQLTGLSERTYICQAVIADAAGNRGTASADFTLTIDVTPPTAGNSVAIDSYYDDTPLNIGSFPSSTPTNDPSPLLEGTVSGLQAGDMVRIYRDGTFLGLAEVDSGTGSWTYQVYGLTEGAHNFVAYITDAAGNQGTQSNSFTIRVDLTPPTTGNSISIDTYSDNQQPNVGSFPQNVPTNDTSPLLEGTVSGLQTGDLVLVYEGSTLVGPAEVSGNSWTLQLTGLTEGSHTYTAVIVDAAGNSGTSSSPFTLTVDLTPPTTGNAVAITSYIDDVDPQVGEFGSGTPTNDPEPVLKGTVSGLQTGDIVRIYQGSTLLGTARLDGRGGWTYQLSALLAGVYTFTAVIADAAGNEGTRSADFNLSVDFTAPASTAALSAITEDTGLLDDDFITADQTLIFSITTTGAIEAGDKVQISLDNGTTWLDATFNLATGTWQYDNTANTLAEGTHTVLTRVTDAAGNPGTAQSETVTIDLSVPDAVPTVTHFSDNFGSYQNAVLPSGSYTDDKTPELHGTLDRTLQTGERLAVYQGTVFLGYAEVSGQSWSFTDTRGTLEDGKAYVYRTAVVNSIGRLGETSNEFEVRIDETDTNLAPTVGTGTDRSYSTAVMIGADGQWIVLSDQSIWEGADRKNFTGTRLGMDGLNGHAGGSSYGGIAFGSWTFADYDKDGYTDIFVTDNVHSGASMTVYRGGPDGYTPGLIYNRDIEGTPATPNEVHLGTVISIDINGDGYVDVIIGDSGSDSSTFLLNKGAAASGEGVLAGQWYGMGYNFGPAQGGLAGLIMDHELSGVDLDNNGTVDFVGHAYNNQNGQIHTLSVLLNSGQTSTTGGNWTLSQIFEQVFNYSGVGDDSYLHTISLTWGDFNGDGYLDLFLGQSQNSGTRTNDNLIFYNKGDGTLSQPERITDSVTGQFSLAVDWDCDGRMDIVEVPESGYSLAQSQIWLNSGTTYGPDRAVWNRVALGSAGDVSIGSGRVNLSAYNNATGVTAVDYDWDGDVDLLIATQGNTPTVVVNNPNAPGYGTALHLRILAADGATSFYGNTVMLYDADGNFVASQIINPQSGMGQNDSSSLVHFFGLDPDQTYTAVLMRAVNGVSSDIGGLPQLGANTVENVNSSWDGLKPAEAHDSYVLVAERETDVTDAANPFTGTGYNDVFFATGGVKVYHGGGGTTEVNGVKEWSATGGVDVVDYKLAGNQALGVDLGQSGPQNTGFNTATFVNIEGIYGAGGNDTFTGNSGDNIFNGRGGNDQYNLAAGGRDTIIFQLLDAADALGGNGRDTAIGFSIGRFGVDADADRIDLRELLIGYKGDADGAAHYVDGRAEIDPADRIESYLQIRQEGNNAVLYLDRDGDGDAFDPTALLTLNDVETDLAELLANEQIVLY